MSLLFFDGFENDWTKRWTTIEATGMSIVAGRNGDGLFQDTGTVSGTAIIQTPPLGIASGGTVIVGAAIKTAVTRVVPEMISAHGTGGTVLWALDLNNATFSFDGGTFNSPVSSALSADTWHYVEVKVAMLNSGGSAVVRIDGVQVLSISGDVMDAADQICQYIRFKGTDGSDNVWDDIYVCDGTGASHNNFLGDVFVKQVLPTGQGTHAQGVGSDGNSVDNWQLVDEDPASMTDYVALDSGHRDSYTGPALGVGEVPVAVRVGSLAGNGNGAQQIDHFLRIGATNYDAGDALAVASTAAWKDSYFEQNPSTSLAWAEDDLDGAEFGVRRVV